MVHGGYCFRWFQNQRPQVCHGFGLLFNHTDHQSISLVGSILENTNSELSVPANLEFVECPNIIPFPTVSKNSRPLALIEASKRDPIAKATKIRPIITPLDTTQDHDADESLPLPADEEFTRRQLQGMVSWSFLSRSCFYIDFLNSSYP